jgi:K(+)-stimulated pyrophosphate-energized sodium pump
MDELGIIGALALLALAYAASSARWVGGRAGSDRARFLEGVLRAGAGALVARLGRVLALPLVACAGAVFALHLWALELGSRAARLETAIWALASLVLGALASWAGSQIAALVSARAAARSATHGIAREEALEIALRGASATAVVAAALPLLALTVLFGVAVVVLGAEDTPWVAVRTLLGFPLGVALHGAAVQVGAASFSAGASEAERRLERVEPGASPDDARNPATLASLVAVGPARAAARVAGASETAGLELVAALLLSALVAEASRATLASVGVSPIAVVALPLVARAYGLLASIAGVMAVRSDEVEHPNDALARGHWVAAGIQLAGFALTSWLMLRPYWAWLSVAAAIGVAAGYGQLLVTQYLEDARYEPARSIAAAFLGAGEGRARGVSLGVARGLRGTAPSVLLVIALLAIGHLSGETTTLVRGALLGVVVAIGGFLGTAPFVQAAEGAFATAGAADALRRLRGGMPAGEEAPLEPSRLPTSAHALVGASLSALLAVSAITVEAARLRALATLPGRALAGLDPTHPATALAALLGALLAFWYVGRGARAVDVVRTRVVAEARRLLQWLPRDRGAVVYPPEGIVEPAGCVDVGARAASSEALRAALLVVLAILSVGAIFRWTHGAGAEAVIALAWVVSLASAPLGLAVAGAATAWGTAHRLLDRAASGGDGELEAGRVHAALSEARALDELGATLGAGLVAAAPSIAKLTAAAVLALLPLFM